MSWSARRDIRYFISGSPGRLSPCVFNYLIERSIALPARLAFIDERLDFRERPGALLVAADQVADVVAGIGIPASFGLGFHPLLHLVRKRNVHRSHDCLL